MMTENILLEVNNLTKHFPLGGGFFSKPRGWVKALDGVSFQVLKGECFGIVGESGCGKTTLGRLILRLLDPTSGWIKFKGEAISGLSRSRMRPLRKKLQIIFQDPYSSLNPRMRVGTIITEPLRAFQTLGKNERERTAAELMKKVGLPASDLNRYPHEFSGGQRQRIGIARALSVQPELIVADEPVSALDVSIQAQIINLLADLKSEFNLAYIVISHDLGVLEHMCDRIAVMYLGRIVELAPAFAFSTDSCHPYTRALLSAVPVPDPKESGPPVSLEGDVPSPLNPPPGCAFHTRCRYAMDLCRRKRPALLAVAPQHVVACWLHGEKAADWEKDGCVERDIGFEGSRGGKMKAFRSKPEHEKIQNLSSV